MGFEAWVEKSVLENWDCVLGKQSPFVSYTNFQPSELFIWSINGPCRDQPLGGAHPVEFGSIITGEPSPLCKCGTWDMEMEVRGGSVPSACF